MGKSIEATVEEVITSRAAMRAGLADILGVPVDTAFHSLFDINAPDDVLRELLVKKGQTKTSLDSILADLAPEKRTFLEEFIKTGAKR